VSKTFLAILHFDGSGFVGWQRQKAGRSVQAELEAVLEQLTGKRTAAHGAGRTDAGVHATGMGVSVVVPARWDGPELLRALNALLPRDCWVERIHEMAPGFHARKSASGRRYHYIVGTDRNSGSPFRRPFEWSLGKDLDAGAIDQAAVSIVGTHEFRSFAVKGDAKPHYRCAVRRAAWNRRADYTGFRFEIEADRFLHHMVRFLVGTMVDIGLGRRPVSDMAALLARSDNAETSPPAPPQGLYFIAAEYPKECYVDQREALDER
jgi:tRNA pseudouridine38-40 synthase